jgi:glycosyltransferase involved in cell wall biosynthesis
MMRINIVGWHNGGGLSRDIDTLLDVLPPDRFQVSLNGAPREQARIRRRRIVHRASNQLHLRLHSRDIAAAGYDINLFLEDITPGFFKYARANLFIPNPEWFKDDQRRHLQGIDAVLCKTREAQQTFTQLGSTVRFIGFTSEDRCDPEQPCPEDITFLHIAGRSWQKGTAPLLALWQQHPEWPMLTVVQNARTYNQAKVAPVVAPNITHILKRLDDSALRKLQNIHAVHLCPSESEGFGHCIVEAMSCGALTLTTNAPPMNELITSERGVLVDYNRTVKQRSGANYYVDPVDLARKIGHIIAMDTQTRQQLGDSAQRWYRENDRLFRSRFIEALQASLPSR